MAAPFAEELLLDIPEDAADPSMAGALSTTATGANFEAAAETIVDPDGPAITNSQIIATSTVTSAAGTASMIVTLPDGTVMTLVGVTAVTPVLFTLP